MHENILDKFLRILASAVILAVGLVVIIFIMHGATYVIKKVSYELTLKICEDEGTIPEIPIVGNEYIITEQFVTAENIVIVLEDTEENRFDFSISNSSSLYSDILVNGVTTVKCTAPYELEAVYTNQIHQPCSEK